MAATQGAKPRWRGPLSALCIWAASLSVGMTIAEEGANDALDELLAQAIDVNFWRDYPEDVLVILEIRTGLKSVYPGTLERTFTFSHQEKHLPVNVLLQKLTAAGRLEMERRGGVLLFWQRADDNVLKEFCDKLKSADRWARCEAAWELGNLADPRIYPLLYQAAGDPDSGVAHWALFALSKHLAVLPHLDPAGKEMVVKVAQDGIARTRAGFLPGLHYHQLLGALNTPASLEILLAELTSDRIRAQTSAVDGLGYCRDPRAVDALVKLAEEAGAAKPKNTQPLRGTGSARQTASSWLRLPEALARNGNLRCVDALLALSANPHLLLRTRGQCFDALSRTRSGKAADAVVTALAGDAKADWDTFFCPDARDPRIADALAAHVQDIDEAFREMAISALAMARDPRVIAPLMESIEENPQFAYGKPEQLAAIRDPRAEQALRGFIKNDEKGDPLAFRDWGSALMATRDPKVIKVAFDLLKDENKAIEVRSYAAMALAGALNDRRQIAEFIAYLKADGKPVVRAIARQGAPPENLAGAIFSREPAWVEVLLELAHDPDRIIGDAALKLLGVSRNPYAQKALIEALEHPDAPVRLGAVRACAVRNTINQGDTVFAEALAKRLAEEHPALRRAAAIALGQLGDKRAVAPLIEAARTERNTPDALRIWSLLSLFDDPMAAEALIELLRDPNNSQREQALYALNASTNPKVAEAMREMAADEKSPVGLRAAAAMQLCRSGIKDQKVLDILCAVLNDPALDRDCRVYVVGALRTLDDPKVGEALLACIRNKGLDLDVREDIVSLLNARELGADVIKKFIVLLDNEEVPEGIRARVAAMLVVDKSRRGRAVTRSGETDPRVRQALLTLQKSNNLSPHTRRSLMEALVYAGDPTTLQAVYDRIPGAELKMKLHLATALCIAFRDEKAIEPLLDVLKYGEQQDRRNATYALMAYSRSENIHVDVKQKIDAALDEYRKTKNLPVRPPQPPPEEF